MNQQDMQMLRLMEYDFHQKEITNIKKNVSIVYKPVYCMRNLNK